MSGKHSLAHSQLKPSSSALPTWWLVFTRELADLWIGGKALLLIFAYSVLLGFQTYILVKNNESSPTPPTEMVFTLFQIVYYVGGLIGLIIGADSISGERERSTLEALLLTTASRRQIIVGKFLAGLSPWPIAILIAIPFLKVLSQGDAVFGQYLIWGGLLGSLLAIGFTGLGMLVSFWSNSNKISFFVSLGVYLVILLPTTWPGRTVRGFVGKLFQRSNPLEATNEFLEKILVNNRTLAEFQSWITSPAIFAALMIGFLFLFAGWYFRLEARQR